MGKRNMVLGYLAYGIVVACLLAFAALCAARAMHDEIDLHGGGKLTSDDRPSDWLCEPCPGPPEEFYFCAQSDDGSQSIKVLDRTAATGTWKSCQLLVTCMP